MVNKLSLRDIVANNSITVIKITPEDIDEGIRQSCTKCPAALAFQRTIDCEVDVMIEETFLFEKDEDGNYGLFITYHNDYKLRDFVAAFARGDIVKPFEFMMMPVFWRRHPLSIG